MYFYLIWSSKIQPKKGETKGLINLVLFIYVEQHWGIYPHI